DRDRDVLGRGAAHALDLRARVERGDLAADRPQRRVLVPDRGPAARGEVERERELGVAADRLAERRRARDLEQAPLDRPRAELALGELHGGDRAVALDVPVDRDPAAEPAARADARHVALDEALLVRLEAELDRRRIHATARRREHDAVLELVLVVR